MVPGPAERDKKPLRSASILGPGASKGFVLWHLCKSFLPACLFLLTQKWNVYTRLVRHNRSVLPAIPLLRAEEVKHDGDKPTEPFPTGEHVSDSKQYQCWMLSVYFNRQALSIVTLSGLEFTVYTRLASNCHNCPVPADWELRYQAWTTVSSQFLMQLHLRSSL